MKNWLIVLLCSVVLPGFAERPNVVLILGDDIGYGDFGCYGATKVKTPNVDKLATQGLRFTDAHSPSAVCTPTRYAIMTGQYAWRNPLGSHILPGDAKLSIKPGSFTLPSLFQKAGYKTCAVGKWHLGLGDPLPDWNGEIKPGPLEIGFDHCFLIPATGDRAPCVFVQDHRVFNYDPKDPIVVDYEHAKPGHANEIAGIGRIGMMSGGKAAIWKDREIAKTLTARAVKFIEENKDHPFFLYFATHDIHVPRMPGKDFQGSSQAGVRGDTIQQFDWSAGEVLRTLDRLKLRENTLVIVTSDNGGILDWGDSPQRDGDEKSNNGHKFNGPLRGTKGTPWEGGTRIPMIVRWPGKVKPATTTDELVCLSDTLATCTAMLGQSVPKDSAPDSFNLLPIFLGEKLSAPVRDHLVEHGRRMALREGQWKYIVAGGPKGRAKFKSDPAELYNLADDISESHNLIDSSPEKARHMAARLKEIQANPISRPQ